MKTHLFSTVTVSCVMSPSNQSLLCTLWFHTPKVLPTQVTLQPQFLVVSLTPLWQNKYTPVWINTDRLPDSKNFQVGKPGISKLGGKPRISKLDGGWAIKRLGQTSYLFKLSEEVSLEHCFLSLLLPGEPYELSAAVRFDAHPAENLFINTAENDIERPGQDTSIGIRTWSDKSVSVRPLLFHSHFKIKANSCTRTIIDFRDLLTISQVARQATNVGPNQAKSTITKSCHLSRVKFLLQ